MDVFNTDTCFRNAYVHWLNVKMRAGFWSHLGWTRILDMGLILFPMQWEQMSSEGFMRCSTKRTIEVPSLIPPIRMLLRRDCPSSSVSFDLSSSWISCTWVATASTSTPNVSSSPMRRSASSSLHDVASIPLAVSSIFRLMSVLISQSRFLMSTRTLLWKSDSWSEILFFSSDIALAMVSFMASRTEANETVSPSVASSPQPASFVSRSFFPFLSPYPGAFLLPLTLSCVIKHVLSKHPWLNGGPYPPLRRRKTQHWKNGWRGTRLTGHRSESRTHLRTHWRL